MTDTYDDHYLPFSGFCLEKAAECWLVVFDGQIVLNHEVVKDNFLWSSLNQFQKSIKKRPIVLGCFNGKVVGVVEISTVTKKTTTLSLRELISVSNSAVYRFISHSYQILTSRKEHNFCGLCGHQTQEKKGEWAMVCSECGHCIYPTISPCVIVLVTRGDEVLLVRHRRQGRQHSKHSLVAGFVEPGESAETAVYREVHEETGISLGKIHYCLSQSWPFPHTLMLGFHAEYKSGDIVLEQDELCFGGWFHRDSLPDLPPKFTIARKLVDSFL